MPPQQETNKALKLAIKCLKCCLYCFEKTIKFITDYCYVYVALQVALTHALALTLTPLALTLTLTLTLP